MALRVIPIVPGNRASTRRAQLSGREYRIDLRWSDFEGIFYLDLYTAAAALLAAGIRVVSNAPLLAGRHGVDGVPPGELVVMNVRPTPSDPGLDDLGETMRLTYWEPITTPDTTVTTPAEAE
jgi:hypothetical protein